MILSCPSCETKFRVKDDAIGAAGRKVKCRNCAHVWHAMPESAEAPAKPAPAKAAAKPAPAPKPAPEPAPRPAPEPDPVEEEDEDDFVPPPPPPSAPAADEMADFPNLDGDEPPAPSEAPAPPEPPTPPPIPPADDFVLRQRKPKVEKKSPVMAWIILLVIVLVTLASGFFFQKQITAAYPPMARVYEWVGLQPNMLGYGLELPPPSGARAERTDDGLLLIITGEIHSTLGDRADIPLLRGALIDTNRQELHVWTFHAEKPDILPGETVTYTTEIMNPPEGVTEALITFQAEDPHMMDGDAPMEHGEAGDGHADDGHSGTGSEEAPAH